MQSAAAVAFWVSTGLLVLTFAGYPLIVSLLARRKTLPSRGDCNHSVCVLIVAYNEAEAISARIQNLLDSDYPPSLFRVVVVSDGSTDDTIARLAEFKHRHVEAIECHERKGKAAGLNTGLAAITEPFVVLTDVRQRFERDTIKKLVSRLANPEVGAVTGELQISNSSSGTGSGVDAYWRLECRIRRDESLIDSCIGCTGAVYSIRRELFTPLPEDTVLDDVVIPMHIALSGKRIIHDPEIRAFDPQKLDPSVERRRKRRTLAGNFQMLFRYPTWILPWRNRLWGQLIVHKYLRLAGPVLLAGPLVSSFILSDYPFYRAALLFQAAFYSLALIGMLLPLRSIIVTLPAGFVFLNTAVIRAFWHYLVTPNPSRWQKNK